MASTPSTFGDPPSRRRFLLALLTIAGVVTVVFLMLRLAGNPALLIWPPNATTAEIRSIGIQLGMNHPLIVQCLDYLKNLVHGNFGFSYSPDEPTLTAVAARVPYTAVLTAAAFLLTIAIAVPAGVLMAINRAKWIDRLLLPLVVAEQSCRPFRGLPTHC